MALVLDKPALEELVDHYLGKTAFVFDVETMGEHRADPHRADLVWISMSCEDRTDIIPMGHPNGDLVFEGPALLKSGIRKIEAGKTRAELKPYDFSKREIERRFGPPPPQLERHEVLEALSPLFAHPGIMKIGHNIKFDLHVIRQYLGLHAVSGPYFDTLIASWLLDVGRQGQLSLDACVRRELGIEMDKSVGKDISKYTFEEVERYSGDDAGLTWLLYLSLDKQFRSSSAKMRKLLNMEHMLLEAVLTMESTGVSIDLPVLASLDKDLRADLTRLEADIYRAAGRIFNIRSNKDKQEVLFRPKAYGGQGLRPVRLTEAAKNKTSPTIYDYAVDKATLDKYQGKSKVVDLLREYSQKSKLHSTYVLPYVGGREIRSDEKEPKFIPSRLRMGKIFAQFLQHGTESGRFSSRGPNLQNIPSRTTEGMRVRQAFIPDPGMVFVVADYSQIEPRIVAALSGDRTLVSTYLSGGDVYQVVADRMGVTRAAGKELVLSITYGIGVAEIAARLKCSVHEAKDLVEFFRRQFPDIGLHKAKVVGRARVNRYSETLFGRRRPLPRIVWSNPEESARAERQAYNHLIQGTAADIMKIAIINIHAELPEEADLLMTIHDEVVVQCPPEMADEVRDLVVREMESARPASFKVPLVVEAKIASNWKEGK